LKKLIVCLFLIILLSGCGNKKEETITMNCNNMETVISIKEKDSLICKLLGEDYIFKVDKIEDNSITISANKNGLSDNGLTSKDTKWIIKKNEKLILHTQTTDYQEYVTFNW
jgi:uncharacterized lipoprotein YehR (DUF1307 family)